MKRAVAPPTAAHEEALMPTVARHAGDLRSRARTRPAATDRGVHRKEKTPGSWPANRGWLLVQEALLPSMNWREAIQVSTAEQYQATRQGPSCIR